MLTVKILICIFILYLKVDRIVGYVLLYDKVSTIADQNSILTTTSTCQEGDIYPSLTSCFNHCSKSRLTQNENSDIMSYKMVIFNQTEYQLQPNDNLLLNTDLPIRMFNTNSYFITNNQAYVCYPLNSKLNTCFRETLTPENQNKFELNNNQRLLHIKGHQSVNLTITDFYRNSEGIVVCKYFSQVTTLNLIGFAISDTALIATFVMTLILPSLRRKNNESLLCHMVMLFINNSIMTLKIIIPVNFLNHVCPALALVEQFSYLSAFTWMNVLFYSLHKSFISLHPVTGFSIKRFRLSCLYAFGIPLVITVITELAQLLKPPFLLDPHLEEECWFSKSNWFSAFLYFYAPMACALGINIVFYIMIFRHMRKLEKEVMAVNKNIHTQICNLSRKLALVMGFCWITKVIIWATDDSLQVWQYIDVVNSFQGVFIFFVYAPTPQQLVKECKSKKLNSHSSASHSNFSTSISTISNSNNPNRQTR